MRKRSSTARAGLGKPQSPRRAAMTTDRRTLPLALSPVNQIVTPFWLSRDARSSAFTEPVHPRPDQSVSSSISPSRAGRPHRRGK